MNNQILLLIAGSALVFFFFGTKEGKAANPFRSPLASNDGIPSNIQTEGASTPATLASRLGIGRIGPLGSEPPGNPPEIRQRRITNRDIAGNPLR